MGLRIKLRPGEKLYINGALVENGGTTTSLQLLNKVTLLREKDILLEKDCDTPCKRVYLVLQSLYLSQVQEADMFQVLTKVSMEIIRVAPSTAVYFEKIVQLASENKYYKAIKVARELIQYEEKLLSHAKSTK